ncbi:MAG: inverse autotransporter beta domain-containing protein, partial [Gammaproteobacteria bacterium]
MLVFTGVVVLSVPGETKGDGGVPVRNHIKVNNVGEINRVGGFLYSDWLRTDATAANQQDIPATFGSFVLSRSLLASVYDEVKNEWRQILQGSMDMQTAQGWVADAIADGQMGLADKWKHSSQEVYLQLAQTTTDSVLGAMAAGAEERAIVIRSVDWDLQLPVGDKDFQLGVNFLGSLHEKPDEAFLWQLRSYAGQNRTKGGNFGLIYRQARKDVLADGEAMYGGNAFLDYESGDDGDFLRWSLGLEYRSELLALYGNRYLALTDGKIQEDGYVYSADGYDVEAAWQLPEHPNVSGFVGYYLWEGENGDDDLKGIRYGTRLSFGEDGAEVELEFDAPEGSSKVKWGLQVSYLHKFGVPASGAVETAERQFDPRNYFYDTVEREYAQKIRRSSGGGWRAAVVGLSGSATALQAQLSNDEVLATLVGVGELPYSFNMLVNTTLAIGKDIGTRVLGGGDSFAMDLSSESAAGSVTVSFIDQGRQLRLFPGAEVSLYHNGRRKPNIEYMAAAISMTLSPQQEQTDLQAWRDDDTLAVLLYEGAVAFAQNNAASVLVLGREAEARVWTVDGITVVGGCGSGKERKNFVDDNGVAINAKTYCAPIVIEPVGAMTVSADLPSPILLANISASGGSGNYRYSVVAGADFSFQGADLFLSPPDNFYLLTATVEVSDDTGVSTPGTLVVTVERAVEAIMANSSGYYRVAHLEGRIIATLSPAAGFPPYTFVLDDGSGEFTLVAATDDLSAELHINAVEGPTLFTVTVKIDDQDISQGEIDRIFTVEVLPPIVIEPVGTITVNADLPSPILLANIVASGGSGNYRYSVVAGADFSFQGADLFLSPPNNIFYLLTATVEVSDDTGVSTPVTLVVTVVRAVEAIM